MDVQAAAADVSRWTSAVRKNREAEQLVRVLQAAETVCERVAVGARSG